MRDEKLGEFSDHPSEQEGCLESILIGKVGVDHRAQTISQSRIKLGRSGLPKLGLARNECINLGALSKKRSNVKASWEASGLRRKAARLRSASRLEKELSIATPVVRGAPRRVL